MMHDLLTGLAFIGILMSPVIVACHIPVGEETYDMQRSAADGSPNLLECGERGNGFELK